MRGAHGQPTNSSGAGRAHPERMGRNAGVERKLRCAVLGARAELSQGAKHGLAPPASDRRLIGHEVRKHDCRRAAGWTGKLHRCSVFRWHSLARRQVHAHCLGSCGSGAIGVGAGLGFQPPVIDALLVVTRPELPGAAGRRSDARATSTRRAPPSGLPRRSPARAYR